MTTSGQSVSGGVAPRIDLAPDSASETAPETAPFEAETPDIPASNSDAPASWSELRGNEDIQFEPIEVEPPPPPEPIEPSEPSWFGQALAEFFAWLGQLLGPIGAWIGAAWVWLQWVLLALVIAFVIYLLVRTFGPMLGIKRAPSAATSEPEWAPSEEQSVALLSDADQLAAEGKYDEATRLLLQRSVGHISDARPEWVEPSSTARELAALPALSQAARRAFAAISERVERSLFALRSLDRSDWEAAREAYAEFALTRFDESRADGDALVTEAEVSA